MADLLREENITRVSIVLEMSHIHLVRWHRTNIALHDSSFWRGSTLKCQKHLHKICTIWRKM